MNKDIEAIEMIEKHLQSIRRTVKDEDDIRVIHHDINWNCDRIEEYLSRIRFIPTD